MMSGRKMLQDHIIASLTLIVTADQARQLAEARRTGDLDVLLLPPPEVPHP